MRLNEGTLCFLKKTGRMSHLFISSIYIANENKYVKNDYYHMGPKYAVKYNETIEK